MLLVAGEHLVAGPELEAAHHGVHAVGRGAGESDILRRRAEQLRGPSAELSRQLHHVLVEGGPGEAPVALSL